MKRRCLDDLQVDKRRLAARKRPSDDLELDRRRIKGKAAAAHVLPDRSYDLSLTGPDAAVVGIDTPSWIVSSTQGKLDAQDAHDAPT